MRLCKVTANFPYIQIKIFNKIAFLNKKFRHFSPDMSLFAIIVYPCPISHQAQSSINSHVLAQSLAVYA